MDFLNLIKLCFMDFGNRGKIVNLMSQLSHASKGLRRYILD